MKSVSKIINEGGIAVIKTDTLYGIVASVRHKTALNKIYHIKNRDPLKACIVLISSILDIKDMGFHIPNNIEKICNQKWPGKVSIILDAPDTLDLYYLHRGTGGVAFRLPDDVELQNLLHETGPLVAPSANPEGLPPAKNIKEAMNYFGNNVNYYLDGGECTHNFPSSVIRIRGNGNIEILRP